MAHHSHDSLPAWTWIAPAAAASLLALKFAGLVSAEAGFVLAFAAALLGGAVFASVHHAEVLAARLGEPFGSLLLAVAVTVIEVALIVSILVSGMPGSDAVARDTVFSAVMIVANGIVLGLIHGQNRAERIIRWGCPGNCTSVATPRWLRSARSAPAWRS